MMILKYKCFESLVYEVSQYFSALQLISIRLCTKTLMYDCLLYLL